MFNVCHTKNIRTFDKLIKNSFRLNNLHNTKNNYKNVLNY